MSVPGSVFQGQGQGVPVQFGVKHGVLAVSDYVLNTALSAGAPLAYDTTAPSVVAAGAAETRLAGVLGEDFIDPSSLPEQVKKNLWMAGILNYNTVGSPASAWKIARIFVTNVSGSVGYGDFLGVAASSLWVSTTTTNDIRNGSVVCVRPNTVAGGPIEILVNLA